jgi:serine-type D-Ala-D-Ala carboxypeptidase/endopeptidase (penicillin-binding protein 4)
MRRHRGFGTLEGGLKELQDFLTGIGVPEKQYDFRDGSGLSRLTLVTPTAISKLLLHMYNSSHRDVWLATLPIGGADGTLEDRFAKVRAAADIHAKTGSISHVDALSGYAMRRNGRPYAFSIVVNNYNCSSAEVRKVVDRIALTLVR